MTPDGRPPAADMLARLMAALTHRGPDGHGQHVRDGVGLINTRLAIVDLAHGQQPLIAPDGVALDRKSTRLNSSH